MRISANLASAAPPCSIQTGSCESRQGLKFSVADEGFVDSSLRVLCCEQIDGRRWKYVAEETAGSGRMRKSSIRTIGLHAPQAPVNVSFSGFVGVVFVGFVLINGFCI